MWGRRGLIAGCTVFLVYASGDALAEGTEVVSARVPGGDAVVTLSEGPGEPRSVGSYALRLYDAVVSEWPYDRFVEGVVRRRKGSVRDLVLEDIDGDGKVDVVVVVGSVGSGGYRFADGFGVNDGRLRFLGSVEWLDPGIDPVERLRGLVMGEGGGAG